MQEVIKVSSWRFSIIYIDLTWAIELHFVSEELHSKESISEHEEKQQHWETTDLSHCLSNLDQDDLEWLPRSRKLEDSQQSDSSESCDSTSCWDSFSEIKLVNSKLKQTHSDDEGIEHVEPISAVVHNPHSCHLDDHFKDKEPSEDLIENRMDLDLRVTDRVSIEAEHNGVSNDKQEHQNLESSAHHYVHGHFE